MNATAEPSAATARATDLAASRRHVVLRHRLGIDGAGLPMLAAGLFVVTLALTAVVSVRFDVRISGWDVAAQVGRWFVGAVGVHLTAVYLPLYVTHGLTRRRVAGDAAIFAALYALIGAMCVAVGYALESFVYRLAGWEHGLDGHLFDSPAQAHLVVAEYGAAFLVYLAAGALLGAGFYRSPALGFALLVPAIAAVVAVEAGIGAGVLLPPPLLHLAGLADPGVLGPTAVLGTAVALAALLGGLTWPIVRDVPIRNQAT